MIFKRLIMALSISSALAAHPLVDIDVTNMSPKQGDAIWIKINASQPIASGTIKLKKKTFKLFKNNREPNQYLTCIGISRYIQPKKTNLTFSFTFADGSTYQTTRPIRIESANFIKEHIKLTPKKYKISQDKSSRKSENRLIGNAFQTTTPSKKFSGPFIWPVDGRITSDFGTQRVYNNKPGWSHSGTDISAELGTPIKASQSGTIILAKSLNVHGNTVMINHGWGIVSIYNHLDKINVKINDKISKGDMIGTVGSTGIATGTHLHFGISVQSIRVNPKDWVFNTSTLAL
jgi:murein DD-endopeptidase MepM/ murein hydrolase activator NlpD